MPISIPNVSPEDKFHVSFDEENIYLKYSNPRELSPETSQIFIRNTVKYMHRDFMDLFVSYLEKHPTIYQYNNLRYAVNALMHIEALLGKDITDKQYDITMKREIDPVPLEAFKVRYMGNKIVAVISMDDEGRKFPAMFYRFRPGSKIPILLNVVNNRKAVVPEMASDADYIMDRQYRSSRDIVEKTLESIREKYLGKELNVIDDFNIPEELELLFDKNHITEELMNYMNAYAKMIMSLSLDSDTICSKTHFVDAERFTMKNLYKIEYYQKKYKDSISANGNIFDNSFSVNNLIQLIDLYVIYVILDHAYMEKNRPTMYPTIYGNWKDLFGNISKENFRRFLCDLRNHIWFFDDRYSTSFTRFLKGYYESL